MTGNPRRLIFDTNVVISAVLRPGSVPNRAIQQALHTDTILTSDDALSELMAVLQRPKFQTHAFLPAAVYLLSQLTAAFEPVEVGEQVRDCRDPRDNIFLSLALSGQADLIITGDLDLLALHAWRNISILTPADFLAQTNQPLP